jgi:anti-sigma regulatory factor (Ser/Thr protein kinase)
MEVLRSSVLVLPFTASSVGVARRRLLGDLAGAGVCDSTACDAGLVLSELVSNALRHATPLADHTLKACWQLGSDSVEIAVTDGGGPTVPTVMEPVAGQSAGAAWASWTGCRCTGTSATLTARRRSGRRSPCATAVRAAW